MNDLHVQHPLQANQSLPAKRTLEIPVAGGLLRVYQTGTGSKIVLALHGLSDNHLSLQRLADGLDSSYTFLVPDLRGRGASSGLPGPFGLDAHAADCAKALDYLQITSAVVVGHSMGALIAERLAAQRPSQVRGIVLIDGGMVPNDEFPAVSSWLQTFCFRWLIRWHLVNMEKVIFRLVGPILDNLRRTFATEEEYFEIWRKHPAFHRFWNEDLQARFQYDLVGDAPAFHSRVSVQAVKEDFTDTLSNMSKIGKNLRDSRCPLRLVRATRGLLDQPQPMISDKVVVSWTSKLPVLQEMVIEDTSHTSIVLLDRAVRLIAMRIQELSS